MGVYNNIIQFFMNIAFINKESKYPIEIKKIISSRFYSILNEYIQKQCYNNKKIEINIIYNVCNEYYDKNIHYIHEEYYNETQLSNIHSIILKLQQDVNKEKDDDKGRMIQSCCNLVYILYIQLFHIYDNATNQDDDDDDDDDVLEEIDI